MSHTIENVSQTKRKISVTVEANDVDKTIDKTIREYGKA